MRKHTYIVTVKYYVTKKFFVYADTAQQATNKVKRNINNDKLKVMDIIEKIEEIGVPLLAINSRDIENNTCTPQELASLNQLK